MQYTTLGANNASEGQALVDFSRGLAGAAPNGVPRSSYLFDAVNLPQVLVMVVAASPAACASAGASRPDCICCGDSACMPLPHLPAASMVCTSFLPLQVINQMAAQTLILNQDRCTKNFYIYFDHVEAQWSMFPWDPESGGWVMSAGQGQGDRGAGAAWKGQGNRGDAAWKTAQRSGAA